MIGAIPFQNAIMMVGYGYGKRWCEQYSPDNVLLGTFIGGCTAGIAQSFLMSPVELIKINQQVVGKSLSSATSMVLSGVFSKNVAWKGLSATVLRDGIPHGVWFSSFEYFKKYVTQIDGVDSSKHAGPIAIVSGSCCALTAWGVGYPADVIKTRIQAVEGTKQLSVTQATKEILKESNGRVFAAFYRGFWLKIAKAVPASAINFFVYETVANQLRHRASSS